MPGFIFFVMFVVFVSTLGGLLLWKLFDIVRNSIRKNRSSYDEDRFDKLAKAFIRHRDATDKRLQNIEAILTQEEQHSESPVSSDEPSDKANYETVELDNELQNKKEKELSIGRRNNKKRSS